MDSGRGGFPVPVCTVISLCHLSSLPTVGILLAKPTLSSPPAPAALPARRPAAAEMPPAPRWVGRSPRQDTSNRPATCVPGAAVADKSNVGSSGQPRRGHPFPPSSFFASATLLAPSAPRPRRCSPRRGRPRTPPHPRGASQWRQRAARGRGGAAGKTVVWLPITTAGKGRGARDGACDHRSGPCWRRRAAT